MSSNKFWAVAIGVVGAGITYVLYGYIAEGHIHSKRFDISMDDSVAFWLVISAGAVLVAGCFVSAVAFWRLVDPPT